MSSSSDLDAFRLATTFSAPRDEALKKRRGNDQAHFTGRSLAQHDERLSFLDDIRGELRRVAA
jgi:hypothetical protein